VCECGLFVCVLSCVIQGIRASPFQLAGRWKTAVDKPVDTIFSLCFSICGRN